MKKCLMIMFALLCVSMGHAETELDKILGLATLNQVIYSPDGKKLARGSWD